MPLYMDGEHENQYFKWYKCAGYMGEQVQNLFRLLCSLKGHVASAGRAVVVPGYARIQRAHWYTKQRGNEIRLTTNRNLQTLNPERPFSSQAWRIINQDLRRIEAG
jgi:hypothetical protein